MRRLWNVEELAECLGVHRKWVYERTRRSGPEIIPHIKLGRYVRFDPNSEEFQSWLERHRIVGLSTQRRL